MDVDTVVIKKPDYIEFLLSKTIRDQMGFHVNVGTPGAKEAERIGCLRWMLIARSKVLRTMLLESELKEGDEISMPDLKLNTFMDFLTYAYGHDHTKSLKFEESIELLEVAEKYDVEDLKSCLAGHITPQVSADNVCTVLQHGPVCETVPALWEKTTEIIQSKTEVVLALPQFLTLNSTAVVHILQQDALSVPEIDVWHASLKWAKSQHLSKVVFSVSYPVSRPNPSTLREVMLPLLKHTRMCTFTQAQLCNEVVPADVITLDEFKQICAVIKKKEEQTSCAAECTDLVTVCNNVIPRQLYVIVEVYDSFDDSSSNSTYIIWVKKFHIRMESIEFECTRKHSRCAGTIYVTEISSGDELLDLSFDDTVSPDKHCHISLEGLELNANTVYQLDLVFSSPQPGQSNYRDIQLVDSDDLDVRATQCEGEFPLSHLYSIRYRVDR